jgi:hypothetical protein
MKTRNSLALRMLCSVLALAAVAVTASPARADDNQGQTSDIHGAWQFVLSTGSGSLNALGTFTQDGIFVGTAQGDGLCCASQGAAHGTWKQIGSRTFTWTLRALQANADFTLSSILNVTITVTLDQPKHMTGVWSGSVTDPSGNLLHQVGGTITGTRYAIP